MHKRSDDSISFFADLSLICSITSGVIELNGSVDAMDVYHEVDSAHSDPINIDNSRSFFLLFLFLYSPVLRLKSICLSFHFNHRNDFLRLYLLICIITFPF